MPLSSSLIPQYFTNNFSFTQTNVIKKERIIGLDVIRSIAILMVVTAHSIGFLTRLGNVPFLGKIISVVVDHIQPLGLFGVELFFVLSGFLIGGILIKAFISADDFPFSAVRNFWVRRWYRTLPNYWLILTVDVFLYKAMNLQGFDPHQLLYYFFLQNLWYPDVLNFFGEGWSLSIEEWFYLTLPVAMYLAALIFKPGNKRLFLLRVFAGYISVFILIRFFNAFSPVNGANQEEGIRKVVLFRLDAVMFGVLFAYFNYFRSDLLVKVKKYLLVIGLCGTAILFYLVSKRDLEFRSSSNPSIRFVSDALLYLFIPLFFSFCLPYANSIKALTNKYGSNAVQHISKISYSMYLVHYSLVFLPFFYEQQVNSGGMVVAMYLWYWIIVIGVSSLLYKYFERPVMNLRDKFSRQ